MTNNRNVRIRAVQNERMRVKHCVIIDTDGEICYVGTIKDAPAPSDGSVMILHPVDYEKLSIWFNSYRH